MISKVGPANVGFMCHSTKKAKEEKAKSARAQGNERGRSRKEIGRYAIPACLPVSFQCHLMEVGCDGGYLSLHLKKKKKKFLNVLKNIE